MKTTQAQTHFEQAVAIAEQENNVALAQLARGMLDMLAALKSELRQIREAAEKAAKQ